MQPRLKLFAVIATLLAAPAAFPQQEAEILGSWELLPALSHDIGHLRNLAVELRKDGSTLTIIQMWGRGRQWVRDSVTVTPGGPPVEVVITRWPFVTNVFMGLRLKEGEKRTIQAVWEKNGLKVTESYAINGSQGPKPMTVIHRYAMNPQKELLLYSLERTTRKTGPPIEYRLKKAGTRQAFTIRLGDNWEVGKGLPTNALMISLQGLANKNGPLVYLLYQDNWEFTYVNSVHEFYQTKRYYTFRPLTTPAEALRALAKYAKGYVVWDTAVRTSLIVAYTVAGLEDAAVVTEDLIGLAEQFGLKKIEDLRGTFKGMKDAQIYQWALDKYWSRCSREYIIWLGGEHGQVMKPAVADWGIRQKVFFNDLSTRVTDTAEYAIAKRLLSEMKPYSMVMGWHSYAKDLEEEHVELTSSFGHRVEGLNTLPNLSFSAQIPVSPGFTFQNNHHVKPGEKITPAAKVYVTCIQTDGMGLGAWLKPGRGEIPYAWEVLMNYTWMAPGMAEYFYSTKTPNDYMIGCLSGPGYLYPKAVPRSMLPELIAMAWEQMKTLDLRVFETMDWSEGDEVSGNTDLPMDVIEMYTKGMPGAIGFVNGYGPGYTFTVRDGKPWMSYDYYLSPYRPEADAVADLQELATVNSARPYFLLVHVREYSDVKRVKGILDKLGPEFEVVPLDVFLTMAASKPTFKERTLKK